MRQKEHVTMVEYDVSNQQLKYFLRTFETSHCLNYCMNNFVICNLTKKMFVLSHFVICNLTKKMFVLSQFFHKWEIWDVSAKKLFGMSQQKRCSACLIFNHCLWYRHWQKRMFGMSQICPQWTIWNVSVNSSEWSHCNRFEMSPWV